MKPLNQPETHSAPKTTPAQQLIEELVRMFDDGKSSKQLRDKFSRVVTNYDVALNHSSSIVELPDWVEVGSSIKLTYNPAGTEQVFTGLVYDIFYKMISYPMSAFSDYLSDTDMSEEQKTMLNMTIYEETKPKIYDRLVLNSNEQGILIIPLVKGVTIEQGD